jgi:hypothetical protein
MTTSQSTTGPRYALGAPRGWSQRSSVLQAGVLDRAYKRVCKNFVLTHEANVKIAPPFSRSPGPIPLDLQDFLRSVGEIAGPVINFDDYPLRQCRVALANAAHPATFASCAEGNSRGSSEAFEAEREPLSVGKVLGAIRQMYGAAIEPL